MIFHEIQELRYTVNADINGDDYTDIYVANLNQQISYGGETVVEALQPSILRETQESQELLPLGI